MRKRLVPVAALLLSACLLPAQSDPLQFWPSFHFDWKPARGLTLELEKQLRYRGTLAGVESDITQAGVRFRPNRWLALQANYRFTGMGDEKRHRLDGSLELGWKWSAIAISNRFRLQQEWVETTLGRSSELVFRDRLRLTFRRDRDFRPYLGGEIFLGLNPAGRSEEKYRLTAGLECLLSKRVTLSLFCHRQKDLGEKTNETGFILGTGFHYTF